MEWAGVFLGLGVAVAGCFIGNGLGALGDGLWRMGDCLKEGLINFNRDKPPEDPPDNGLAP